MCCRFVFVADKIFYSFLLLEKTQPVATKHRYLKPEQNKLKPTKKITMLKVNVFTVYLLP